MWLFDFLNKPSEIKESPSVKVISSWWIALNLDLSFEVYYKYYNLNPFVFACINKRSNDVGVNGFELTRAWKTIYNNELEDMLKLSTTPNSKEFFKRLVRDYDITWNCYVYIVKDESGKNIGLQVLDPRYIKPVTDKYWTLLWYIQNLNWVKVFLKNEVFHLKNDSDIDNEVVWKSRMTSLFIDIESDQEARESNLAFFKNNQTPSSLIVIDPDFELKEENLKDVREKIKEMFEWWKYKGWKNKHRSMTAQGIKEVIKIQDKINDMEFLELRKFALDIVSAIYEVPKSILWFTEQTNYSNWLTQYDIYYDNIEALERKFAEYLQTILRQFDPRYNFKFLQDNLRKLNIKSWIAGVLYRDKNLITLNEAREIIQYEPLDEWNKLYEVKSINTPINE